MDWRSISFALVVHDFGGPIGLPLLWHGRVHAARPLNTWMWPFDDDKEMANRARLVSGAWPVDVSSPERIAEGAHAVGVRGKSRLTQTIHRQYLEPFREQDDRVLVLWPLAHSLLGSSAFIASCIPDRRAPGDPVDDYLGIERHGVPAAPARPLEAGAA